MWAFDSCTSLTELSLESNLEYVANDAFKGCTGISRLYYNVPFQGDENWNTLDLTSVAKVTVGSEVRILPYFGSANLMKIELEPRNDNQPLEINVIGGNNDKIKSIVFPQTLKYIPDGCFTNAKNLESVSFVSEVIAPDFYIGENAFAYCESLKSFDLPKTTVSIGNRAFFESGLESIVLPEGLKSVGGGAFVNCLNNQEMLVLPTSLETFSSPTDWFYPSAFSYSGIKGVAIPGNLIGRADLKIEMCPSLETLIIEKGGEELAMTVEGQYKEFNIPEKMGQRKYSYNFRQFLK